MRPLAALHLSIIQPVRLGRQQPATGDMCKLSDSCCKPVLHKVANLLSPESSPGFVTSPIKFNMANKVKQKQMSPYYLVSDYYYYYYYYQFCQKTRVAQKASLYEVLQ